MSDTERLEVVVGADGGNSSAKIRLENYRGTYEMAHCRRPINQDKDYEVNNAKALKIDLVQLHKYLDVSVKLASDSREKEFLFGEMANYKGDKKVERADTQKSDDTQLVRNTLVSIANSIVESYKLEGDSITVDLSICTGLPVLEHEIKEKREKYLEKYNGEHTIKFLHPAYPVKELIINVKNNYVEIEGSAALRQEIANEGLMTKDPNEMDGCVYVMIDIGCLSTDGVGARFKKYEQDNGKVVNRINIDSDLGFGLRDGIGKAQNRTISRMNILYKSTMATGDKFTRKEIAQASMNEGVIQGKISKSGEKFKVEPFYTDELVVLGESVGEEFVNLYDSTGNSGYLRKIYLCGGGSLENRIMDEFKIKLEEGGINPDMVKIVEDPIYANANGYYNIARVKSKIK